MKISAQKVLRGFLQFPAYQPLVVTDVFQKPMQDLGTLTGLFGSSYGMAINSGNHVAGYSTINFSDDRVHAFLHDGEKMVDLGTLNPNALYCDTSVALGINSYDRSLATVSPADRQKYAGSSGRFCLEPRPLWCRTDDKP